MTLDFIEDAADALDKSDAPYIIVFGIANSTRLLSNLELSDKEMLRGWLESGHWNQILKDHLDRCP